MLNYKLRDSLREYCHRCCQPVLLLVKVAFLLKTIFSAHPSSVVLASIINFPVFSSVDFWRILSCCYLIICSFPIGLLGKKSGTKEQEMVAANASEMSSSNDQSQSQNGASEESTPVVRMRSKTPLAQTQPQVTSFFKTRSEVKTSNSKSPFSQINVLF